MLILNVIYRLLKVKKVLMQKNIRITFLVVLLPDFFVLMTNLPSQQLLSEVKIAAYEFIEKILKGYQYCKKVMKKDFNKNLIMSEEEE